MGGGNRGVGWNMDDLLQLLVHCQGTNMGFSNRATGSKISTSAKLCCPKSLELCCNVGNGGVLRGGNGGYNSGGGSGGFGGLQGSYDGGGRDGDGYLRDGAAAEIKQEGLEFRV